MNNTKTEFVNAELIKPDTLDEYRLNFFGNKTQKTDFWLVDDGYFQACQTLLESLC